MDFQDKEIIFTRFNSAAYDLALAGIAHRKGDNNLFVKHKRDAGEAISQSLEYALKNHLSRTLSFSEKKFFTPFKQDIIRLIEKYIDENGKDNGYLYSTVNDTIEPSVNFQFLKQNKNLITNASKHEGKEPDFEIQKRYFWEVRKYINQYIDENKKLKTINDYERIDLSTWDLLYSACDRFIIDERNYILIIGPNQNIDKNYLRNLSIPKWNMIIDFDYNSESNGFFECAYKKK